MQRLLKPITSTYSVGPGGRVERRMDQARRQSGYIVISLAMTGLFGGAAAAVPVLNRVDSLLSASDTGPVNQSRAAFATEHALWRLQHDPALWGGMTGSPPSISYQHPACGALSNADVDITALEDVPTGDDRFDVALTVTPEFNSGSFADPAVSSAGWLFEFITLDDRSRYFWNVPPTTINPGASIDLTSQMQAGLEPGTYFSRGSGYVLEAPGGFWALLELSTATTGETAQIEVTQGFTITAAHEGNTVTVTGINTATGIEILSWKEF